MALYLGHLASTGRSIATVQQARSAISHFHAAAGMQKGDNPALHPVVSEAVKGWRNRAPAPRQTGALTADALARVREVDVKTAHINALTAWRPDTGEQLNIRNGPPDTREISKLDRMAQGARFVLGHNLITSDIPHLQTAYPGLDLLSLLCLDTLLERLSSNELDGALCRPTKTAVRS